jgi:cell wall-associated NlpC family hydrolase
VTTPHPILAWLDKQVGIAEIPGGPANDGDPMRLYCNGEKKPGSADGWEWCAAMVRKGFEVVGHKLPHNPKYNATRGQRELWSAANMFDELGRRGAEVPIEQAQPGDIIFFPRGARLIGHVGVVTGTIKGALMFRVETIEGNVSDAVRRLHHDFSRRRVDDASPSHEKWTPYARVCAWPLRK